MNIIIDYFFWILIVTGGLTATMFIQAIAPAESMRRTYGSAPEDKNALMILRHWGFYVGLTGLLLIYAAFEPSIRVPVLWFAIAGKAGYSTLIFMRMSELKGTSAVVNAIADVIMVTLYLLYLVAV